MNRTTTIPAPARTDAVEPATTIVDDRHEARLDAARSLDPGLVRRRGAILAVGATAWTVANFVYGTLPETSLGWTVTDLTGLAFQAGVMALLGVQARTMATGTGRFARWMFPVERVLLSLAMLWSFLHGVFPALREVTAVEVLDVFWPLSMLGRFVSGIKIAVAGRWHGVARVWPLVAETWAVVTVPTFLVAGESAAVVVGGIHMLVGYVGLGLLLALRPEAFRPRR